MQNIIKAQVLGAKRYNIDGQQSASVYIMGESLHDHSQVGVLPMKIPCNYELVDSLDHKSLPCEGELSVTLSMGGGVKASMFVNDIKLSPARKAPASSGAGA